MYFVATGNVHTKRSYVRPHLNMWAELLFIGYNTKLMLHLPMSVVIIFVRINCILHDLIQL